MIRVYIILTIIFASILNFYCSSHRQSNIDEQNNEVNFSQEGTVEEKGALGIGYGAGYGGDSKKVDSLIESLSDTTKLKSPKFTKGGSLNGKRPAKDVMKTIMMNLASMRNVYNERLKEKPDLKGRVTFKIMVLESGQIHKCSIESSTVKDRKFEKALSNKIKKWDFGKVDIPGDTTEIIYPFVFTR